MKGKQQVRLMHGNEACVEAALLAGCRFFAGYPITPASEIAEGMAVRMPQTDGVFMQMEDELASVNALIGASWGGGKPMTATSGPGFSLMQEGIGYAAVTETPCVVINVMRGGPSTGQPTLSAQQDVYQAKYGSHGDYEVVVLVPSSVQEAFDMTLKAFDIAEQLLTPVIILSDEIVGHTRERIVIPEDYQPTPRRKPAQGEEYIPFRPDERGIPKRADFGEGHNILVDGQLHDEWGTRIGHLTKPSAALVTRLCEKITKNTDIFEDVELRETEDADLILVTYGSTSRPALRAMKEARELGLKVGWVKMRTLFPFPDRILEGLVKPGRKFMVPEMNIGKIVNEVTRVTGAKAICLSKMGGEMHTPAEILKSIQEVI